jgi:hypothetical protein
MTMSRTTIIALCAGLAAGAITASAAAQTLPQPTAPPGTAASPDPNAPPDADLGPANREHAVMGGKRLQPHSVPGQSGQSPEAQLRLLQRNARDSASNEPIVVPRDIYGNPLGGNPGLNPPGLEPPPSVPNQVPVTSPKH